MSDQNEQPVDVRCEKCGGIHYGSIGCPYEKPQTEQRAIEHWLHDEHIANQVEQRHKAEMAALAARIEELEKELAKWTNQ